MAYYGASTDSADTNRRFAESLDLDFPVLSDADGKVAEAYGVRKPIVGVASRWTFYIGKDGRILDVDKDVKAGTHGETVAKALETRGVERRR